MWPAPCAPPTGMGPDEVEAGGQTYIRDALVPTWTTYASEARRVIAAVRAMGLMG